MSLSTNKRPKYSKAERAEIFLENDGRCHICGRKIGHGEKWHIEHPTARWSGGSDAIDVVKPAHIDCHAGKTRKEAKDRGRNNRARLRHVGLVEPSGAFRRDSSNTKFIEREFDPDT